MRYQIVLELSETQYQIVGEYYTLADALDRIAILVSNNPCQIFKLIAVLQ